MTNGFASPDPWYTVSHVAGTAPYVGWLYSGIGGVYAPAALTVDGATFTPTVTPLGGATSEYLIVTGLSLAGSTLTLTPDHDPGPLSSGNVWDFLSEVSFDGQPSAAITEPAPLAVVGVGLAGVLLRRARRR